MLSRTFVRALSLRQPAEYDDLIARLRRGEASAVGELYDAHHEALRAFAQRMLGEADSAEDLVHEVFVQLPRAIGRFRGDSSLRSFLIGIAVNHARHHVRSARRRRAAMQRYAEQPSTEAPGPDRDAERKRLLAAVHRGLDRLPVDQRVAFLLCDVEGHSAGEAAAITGAKEATMRTRLHHARRKLRGHLEREGVQ